MMGAVIPIVAAVVLKSVYKKVRTPIQNIQLRLSHVSIDVGYSTVSDTNTINYQ